MSLGCLEKEDVLAAIAYVRQHRPSQAKQVVGVGVSAFWMARYFGNSWIATLLLLILAAISLTGYKLILDRIHRVAQSRRETLVAELCRA